MFKKILFLLLLSATVSADDVRVLPFTGPVGTANIDLTSGATVAYRMDFQGQKAICFKNFQGSTVYFGSHTVTANNGYPLFTEGDSFCADIAGGTTIYWLGTAGGQKVRAGFVR